MLIFTLKLILGFVLIFIWNRLWFRLRRKTFWGKKSLAVRWQLLLMALSDVEWLVTAILIFVISDQVAWLGGLTGLQGLIDTYGRPPTFVLWLLDPTFSGLLSLFVAGVVFGFVTASFGFSIFLAVCLLFPAFIAIPMAVVLIFGEMSGASLRYHWYLGKHAAALRLFVAVVAFMVFWAGGPVVRDLLQGLALNPMQVGDRLTESLLLIFGLGVLDTFLAMLSFHFYFHWTRLD